MRRTGFLCILLALISGCATTPAPTTSLVNASSERLIVITLRNQPLPIAPRAGSTARTYQAPATYALSPATRSQAKAIAKAYSLREATSWPIGLLRVHCVVFELPPQANREEMLTLLRRDPRIESAQAMQSFTTLSAVSNDPYRRLQKNLDVMDIEGAHNSSRGEGVRIAIIDTGVDSNHPDLLGRIVKQENFVDDGAAVTKDEHGTAVAGIIAAIDNNQEGITGVAPAAKLQALRACWPDPKNIGHASCSTLTLAKALVAAIDAHSQIVNLSLTGPSDPLLSRLVEVGLDRGIVFVGAAPSNNDRSSFPTSIDGVISVDSSGGHSDATSVLFAPGTEVLTLAPQGRYDFLSGSSLAAASVSGGIALLLARDHKLRASQAKEILAHSSRSIDSERGILTSVNLCAALAAVLPSTTCGNEVSLGLR